MKSFVLKSLVLLILLIPVLGCGKQGNPVGKWKSEKTADIMEFNKNNTGVIHLAKPGKYPPMIEFNWTMLKDQQLKIEMHIPGAAPLRPGQGRIEGKNTMVFEDDVFKRLTE